MNDGVFVVIKCRMKMFANTETRIDSIYEHADAKWAQRRVDNLNEQSEWLAKSEYVSFENVPDHDPGEHPSG